MGGASIPPEKLLRAQLLQMLYSVRSERLLMEEIDYSILYRWFVGLNLDDQVRDATTFTKNRDRLLEAAEAKEFLTEVVERARGAGLISDEHFTVGGTLLDAWASLKSFQPKDKHDAPPPNDPGNPTVDFHGQKLSNQTHESKTDPDALLARKGKGKSKLSYNGSLLVDNREGLIVNAELLQANGRVERDAAHGDSARYNQAPSGVMAIYQLPSTNAVQTAVAVNQRMKELSATFPPGITYSVPLDTTKAVTAGIHEIAITLFEALGLVVLVVFILPVKNERY
jgi:transposase